MAKTGWVLAVLMALAALAAWFLRPGPPPDDPRVDALETEVARLKDELRAERDRRDAPPLREAPALAGAPAPTPAPAPATPPTPTPAGAAERGNVATADVAVLTAMLTALHPKPIPTDPDELAALARDPNATAEQRTQALLALAGHDARRAVDETERLLSSRDPADVAVGRAAVAGAGDRAFLPLVDRELSRSDARPEDVPALLGAKARLKDRPWSAVQATGAPDTPLDGDLPTAWASKAADMGLVTLDLEYERAVRPDLVRVFETFHPGAVVEVAGRTPEGAWETLWSGSAPRGVAPAVFAPAFSRPRWATREVRLVLDTTRVEGWNEIDAVELGGDGLRQWATGAKASSSYSDP